MTMALEGLCCCGVSLALVVMVSLAAWHFSRRTTAASRRTAAATGKVLAEYAGSQGLQFAERDPPGLFRGYEALPLLCRNNNLFDERYLREWGESLPRPCRPLWGQHVGRRVILFQYGRPGLCACCAWQLSGPLPSLAVELRAKEDQVAAMVGQGIPGAGRSGDEFFDQKFLISMAGPGAVERILTEEMRTFLFTERVTNLEIEDDRVLLYRPGSLTPEAADWLLGTSDLLQTEFQKLMAGPFSPVVS